MLIVLSDKLHGTTQENSHVITSLTSRFPIAVMVDKTQEVPTVPGHGQQAHLPQ